MKKQQVAVVTAVEPAMEVYDAQWRLLGYVGDHGTKVSLEVAREVYPDAAHVLPTLMESTR